METNNEYKGLLGCFPDTIAVHKVRQDVEELYPERHWIALFK